MKAAAVTWLMLPAPSRVRIVSVVVPVPGVVITKLVVVAEVVTKLPIVAVLAVKISKTVVPNSVKLVKALMIAVRIPPPSTEVMVLVVELKVRAVLYSSVELAITSEKSTVEVPPASAIVKMLVVVLKVKFVINSSVVDASCSSVKSTVLPLERVRMLVAVA